MKKVLLPFAILILWSVGISAQTINPQIISSSGNSYTTNTMVIDWTLGELSIMTINGSTNMITQGFHQPKYIVTSVDKLSETIGKINVYPNPTTDIVHINMTFDKIMSVQLRLVDSNGKVLWNKKYVGQNMDENTSFKSLPNGIYFLSFLIKDTNSKQTFKIQKIN
ncbi:MAG TPA: T9SS type A sorting domain-containing protein [Paludibacter sp.]|jgi:hypothetical protein|nr:T9SS type A sorting domain-containing protein [Paludibacter sp.]